MEQLRGKLIVSAQALPDEPLYSETESLMGYMAVAAKLGGAAAIRTSSVRDVLAVKEKVDLPVIGLIKRQYAGFLQHITVTMQEIDELVLAGSDIVAFDATKRERVDGASVGEFIASIKQKYPNLLLMADISTVDEGISAAKWGVDYVGTTLSGYTAYSKKLKGPDFELVSQLVSAIDIPVIAEGRIHTPQDAAKMFELGAYAVVVGGAITRPLEITKRFVDAINEV